ncbi:class I SAM-dependent DNA methyltransferase, partial [bacterium]
FFLPWAGLEKTQVYGENPADIKAAVRMGRLYDLILEDNAIKTAADRHALNIFLSRLLFCYFAEDTGVFKQDQFTNGVSSHTSADGSDLQEYIGRVFNVLSTSKRKGLPKYLADFPYVNGGLFSEEHPIPKFSRKSRQIIVECGSLNWRAINPDIFGSMIQAVVHDDERSSLGMHYTSVANIMKVIEPLFLNELREELDAAGNSKKKLQAFLDRLYHIRIFDPACGSGNFLIITFKELCKLEIKAFEKLHGKQTSFKFQSNIRLAQFFGIEIDDFAHETAKLSLWLAEHQMNQAFREVFGDARPTLPLQDAGNIVCGNATRLNWEEVCPPDKNHEVFIIGNPPYLGYSMQSKEQKADIEAVFRGVTDDKNIDYVACWFLLGSRYISTCAGRFAFVSTNSITQGEQVSTIWPHLLSDSLEIGFAYRSFKWGNSAKGNAGVTCVIIGMRVKSHSPKYIFDNDVFHSAQNISPYLTDSGNVFVTKRSRPLSDLPPILRGNGPVDGGHLILSMAEKEALLAEDSNTHQFIKSYVGSHEFINGVDRFCLWIEDADLPKAKKIKGIKHRIELVKSFRLASKKKATQLKAESAHSFAEKRFSQSEVLIIPSVSSERRNYIPVGFLDKNTIISNLASGIYNPPPHILSIVSSRMHMTWVRTVAGRLETRIRYSSALCYNTFPFPSISKQKEAELEELAFAVLDEREQHSEKTLAQLYDPDKMPKGLRDAHHAIDLAVEQCYRKTPFKNDEERLEHLFKLYEKMIEAERNSQK